MSRHHRIKSLIARYGKSYRFERMVKTDDLERYVPDTGTYKAWLQKANSDISASFLARNIVATHVLYMTAFPGNLNTGDRVVGLVSGVEATLHVVSEAEDVAGLNNLWMVILQSNA